MTADQWSALIAEARCCMSLISRSATFSQGAYLYARRLASRRARLKAALVVLAAANVVAPADGVVEGLQVKVQDRLDSGQIVGYIRVSQP